MTEIYVWVVLVFICTVQGCKVGFFGPNCLKPCVYPGFGEHCQEVCNCTKDICNVITGCGECQIGYYGRYCTEKCRYPGFGVQCQRECNCSEAICNHITGCMDILGSTEKQMTSNSAPQCEDGYFGQKCISPCRYPSFGRKCQSECICDRSNCNHIKGCENVTDNQLHSTKNGGVVKPNEQPWLKGKKPIIIAGSAVLFVLTLGATTMAARNCIRHRNRNTEPPEFDSEFSSFQSNEDIADITNGITSVRYCQHEAFRGNHGDEIYANSFT